MNDIESKAMSGNYKIFDNLKKANQGGVILKQDYDLGNDETLSFLIEFDNDVGVEFNEIVKHITRIKSWKFKNI